MINTFYEKLAQLVVRYSISVKKGQRVLLRGESIATELFQALYVEIIKSGGHCLIYPYVEGLNELLYKYGSDEQLLYVDDVLKTIYMEFNCFIRIQSEYNTRYLASSDPKIIAMHLGSQGLQELMKIHNERFARREMQWVIIPFPCHAFAQEANMDLFSYSEFIKKALLLDKDDPIEEWKKIETKQSKIISKLNKTEKIQVIGEDTNIEFSVKGRKWINCCGHNNLPDGEVFTAPLEDSVNGTIRFTYPGIYSGQEIENIYLEFKNGKVINSTADKGEEILHEIIAIENADVMGEFAIGTNYGITDFTKNMLFDEKIGGTLHCALGLAPAETGAKNVSAIHWDILKDMRLPGSKIIVDGKVFYEEGQWKI